MVTDDGRCCSFNMMPEGVMYNDRDEEEEDEFARWEGWSVQDGYSKDDSGDTMPLRAPGPGI